MKHLPFLVGICYPPPKSPSCEGDLCFGRAKKQLHLPFLVGICYLSPKPPFCKGGLFTLAFSRWPLAISKDYRVQRTESMAKSQFCRQSGAFTTPRLSREQQQSHTEGAKGED